MQTNDSKVYLRFFRNIILLFLLFLAIVGLLCRGVGMMSWSEIARGLDIAGILAIIIGGSSSASSWSTQRSARNVSDQYVLTSYGQDRVEEKKEQLKYRAQGYSFFVQMLIVGIALMVLSQLVRSFG